MQVPSVPVSCTMMMTANVAFAVGSRVQQFGRMAVRARSQPETSGSPGTRSRSRPGSAPDPKGRRQGRTIIVYDLFFFPLDVPDPDCRGVAASSSGDRRGVKSMSVSVSVSVASVTFGSAVANPIDHRPPRTSSELRPSGGAKCDLPRGRGDCPETIDMISQARNLIPILTRIEKRTSPFLSSRSPGTRQMLFNKKKGPARKLSTADSLV